MAGRGRGRGTRPAGQTPTDGRRPGDASDTQVRSDAAATFGVDEKNVMDNVIKDIKSMDIPMSPQKVRQVVEDLKSICIDEQALK